MPEVLRDEHDNPIIASYAGVTPQALLTDWQPSTNPQDQTFYAVEIYAYRPSAGTLTAPTGWNMVPWNSLGLEPVGPGGAIVARPLVVRSGLSYFAR